VVVCDQLAQAITSIENRSMKKFGQYKFLQISIDKSVRRDEKTDVQTVDFVISIFCGVRGCGCGGRAY
jgi:hypothetical protein